LWIEVAEDGKSAIEHALSFVERLQNTSPLSLAATKAVTPATLRNSSAKIAKDVNLTGSGLRKIAAKPKRRLLKSVHRDLSVAKGASILDTVP
jgi:hypothetical protein